MGKRGGERGHSRPERNVGVFADPCVSITTDGVHAHSSVGCCGMFDAALQGGHREQNRNKELYCSNGLKNGEQNCTRSARWRRISLRPASEPLHAVPQSSRRMQPKQSLRESASADLLFSLSQLARELLAPKRNALGHTTSVVSRRKYQLLCSRFGGTAASAHEQGNSLKDKTSWY